MSEHVQEQWTYCGRRWDRADNKIVHAWRDGNGDERRFTKFPAAAVGGIYHITVSRAEDGGVLVHGQPEWTGEMAEDNVALQAEDWSANQRRMARAREKRAGSTTLLDDVADQLFEHVRDYQDIETFRAMLSHKLFERLERRNIERARAAGS